MNMPMYAGFDMGGTQLKYGLLDERLNLVFKDKAPTPTKIEELIELFGELWENMKKRQKTAIRTVGFGIPGIFNLKAQRILQSPNYNELNNFPLRPAIARVIEAPFWIDNDANMAAYGEFRCGAGKGVRDMILLTLGTGVGSGIIVDGELLHGSCGYGAEMGHVVVNPEGERCGCGARGCLETEAAAGPIVRNYRQLSGSIEPLTAEEVASRAKKSDGAARKSFDRAAYYLGIGLGSAINTFNPQKILLGGGIMASGKLILPMARAEAKRRSYAASYACCSIKKASLGNDAGLIGAASWARDQLARRT
jgi:glucokinase